MLNGDDNDDECTDYPCRARILTRELLEKILHSSWEFPDWDTPSAIVVHYGIN